MGKDYFDQAHSIYQQLISNGDKNSAESYLVNVYQFFYERSLAENDARTAIDCLNKIEECYHDNIKAVAYESSSLNLRTTVSPQVLQAQFQSKRLTAQAKMCDCYILIIDEEIAVGKHYDAIRTMATANTLIKSLLSNPQTSQIIDKDHLTAHQKNIEGN